MLEIALVIYIVYILFLKKTLKYQRLWIWVGRRPGEELQASHLLPRRQNCCVLAICTAGAGEFRLANLGLLVTGDLTSQAS